ncbi:MAG: phosphoesterase PA-phosphatase-like protein [Geminicoccaceae bacterium]|nr:phosphoesterase PA-phosphatase-like protein [Geminicoccaceae bacterium]
MRRDSITGHAITSDSPLPWRRVVTVTVVGFVLAFAIGAGVAVWLQSTGDWSLGLPWERELLLSMDPSAPAVIDWIMLALPWLGTNLTLAPIIAGFAFWLWRKKKRPEIAMELVLAVLGSLLLNALMKDVFDRPRPDLWPRRGQYEWAAYPSGHAIVGIAVYFTITRVIYRELRWKWPYGVAIALLAISLYSRLYLGVHWPTDVIGGLLLGAAWLAVVQIAFAPFHASRRMRERAVSPNPEALGGRSSVEGAGA